MSIPAYSRNQHSYGLPDTPTAVPGHDGRPAPPDAAYSDWLTGPSGDPRSWTPSGRSDSRAIWCA